MDWTTVPVGGGRQYEGDHESRDGRIRSDTERIQAHSHTQAHCVGGVTPLAANVTRLCVYGRRPSTRTAAPLPVPAPTIDRKAHITRHTTRNTLITLIMAILLLMVPSSLNFPIGVLPSSAASVDQRNCSASALTCIRIGLFYCNGTDQPYEPDVALSRSSLPSSHCSSIVGYNSLIDWYRTRVESHGGLLSGAPVFFVPAVMTNTFPHSRRELSQLINSTFFNGTNGAALVDFVILPPGVAWEDGMIRLESAGIPAISSHAPIAALFQCAATAELLRATPQPPCSQANSRRFQYAHGLARGDSYTLGWVSLMQLKKARSVAIITDAQPAMLLDANCDQPSMPHLMLKPIRSGVRQAIREYGMQIVYDREVNITSAAVHRVVDLDSAALDLAHMAATIADVARLNPDGVMIVTARCRDWLDAFERADYAPPSIAATFCATTTTTTGDISVDSSTTFVVSQSQWNSHMTGTEYTETQSWSLFFNSLDVNTTGTSSPRQFERVWHELVGPDLVDSGPGDGEAAVLAAFSMLEGAIALAPNIHPQTVNRQLQLYFEPSFFGLLTTNRYGMNAQKQLVSVQRVESGEWSVVTPQSSANIDFIYPMPNWGQRIYNTQAIGRYTIEWVVVALAITCAIITIILLYAIVTIRRPTYHTYSLARFYYMLIAFGCVVSYASTLSWTVDSPSGACGARLWLFTLAFHLGVTPMIAATYRMWSIMHAASRIDTATNSEKSNQKRQQQQQHHQGRDEQPAQQPTPQPIVNQLSQGVRFSPTTMARKIGLYCTLIFLPHLIVNLIWLFGFGGFSSDVETPDPLRASDNYSACTTTTTGHALMILSIAYCYTLLVIAVIYAWRLRKSMAASLFTDARSIALALSIFALTALVVLAVQVSLDTRSSDASSQSVLFGLRSIGVLLAYQGCFALLTVQRIIAARRSIAAAKLKAKHARQIQPPPPQDTPNIRIGLPSHALESPTSLVNRMAVPPPRLASHVDGPVGVEVVSPSSVVGVGVIAESPPSHPVDARVFSRADAPPAPAPNACALDPPDATPTTAHGHARIDEPHTSHTNTNTPHACDHTTDQHDTNRWYQQLHAHAEIIERIEREFEQRKDGTLTAEHEFECDIDARHQQPIKEKHH